MSRRPLRRRAAAFSLRVALCVPLAACGLPADEEGPRQLRDAPSNRSTLGDLFGVSADPNVTLEVNRYLWQASLEVLNFLPLDSADPFSGVLDFGFGVPPGGGQAYRATVLVQDPALDARSLNVAISSRAGPADPDTVRAVEDAILTRARQIRLRDEGF